MSNMKYNCSNCKRKTKHKKKITDKQNINGWFMLVYYNVCCICGEQTEWVFATFKGEKEKLKAKMKD